jgi:hypothetical protein
MLILCDEILEEAIEMTAMSKLRKSLYKKIFDVQSGKIVISKLAVELIPRVIKTDDIKEIKKNYKLLTEVKNNEAMCSSKEI